MKSRIGDMTVSELTAGVGRYRTLLLNLAVTLLILVALPMVNDDDRDGSQVQAVSSGEGVAGAEATGPAVPEGSAEAPVTSVAGVAAPGAAPSLGTNGTTAASATAGPTREVSAAGAPGAAAASSAPGPDCDPATGRVRMPSTQFAAPCAPVWKKGTSNGGATAQGVTADSIKVVLYLNSNGSPFEVALQGAGLSDDNVALEADFKDATAMLNKYFETYGRKVEVIRYYAGTAGGEGDEGARADAIQVATSIKPFAVIQEGAASINAVFAEETAARGIININGAAFKHEQFVKRSPFLWQAYAGYISDVDRGFVDMAAWIGRRIWGRNAEYAGDPVMKTQKRKIGLLYLDRAVGKAQLDLLDRELAKYGASIAERVALSSDQAQAQTQTRTAIAKMKASGVNVVIPFTSALGPMQEATAQGYLPEWLMQPEYFNTITFLVRLYDQQQMAHAYGYTYSGVPMAVPAQQGSQLFRWEYGRDLRSKVYGWRAMWDRLVMFYKGVQLAGPQLTPQTWAKGVRSAPAFGGSTYGQVTTSSASWTDPDDFTHPDDITEVWWDANAVTPDEAGRTGRGGFRYVANGQRYTIGKLPTGVPPLFNAANTVMNFDAPPASDAQPSYPRRDCKGPTRADCVGQ